MSGFLLSPLGAPSSLATATAVLPDDSDAPRGRGRPAVALLVSGGLHAAALTLFLLATAHSGLEPVRTMAIRAIVDPRIDVVRFAPPPIRLVPPGGGHGGDTGVIEPVDPRNALKAILKDFRLPNVAGGVVGGEPTTSSGSDASTELPATAAPTEDPNVPSVYDEPPVPIVAPEPIYPDIAREAGIEGRVVVHALVTRDGTVAKVNVTGANAILAEAASKAVYVWKFRPAKRKGQIVAAWIVVPVNFRLQ